MKSGPKHLPLSNIKLKGKITGPEWSCGCCGNAFNLKKYTLNKRDKNANYKNFMYLFLNFFYLFLYYYPLFVGFKYSI